MLVGLKTQSVHLSSMNYCEPLSVTSKKKKKKQNKKILPSLDWPPGEIQRVVDDA